MDVSKKETHFQTAVEAHLHKTIVNDVPEQCKAEVMEKDSETDSDKESIHSNWSELIPINVKADKSSDAIKVDTQQRKRSVRNIVLVPYKPRPKDWGTWKIKFPYVTSTIASPPLDVNNQIQDPDQNQNQ